MKKTSEVVSNHPHYDIYCGRSTFYMDKISGKPVKTITISLEYHNENTITIKQYKTYNSFQYDSQGRLIRHVMISKPIYKKPWENIKNEGESLIKEFQWNDDNQMVVYKDSLGNHYEKSWGIQNPYMNKYPQHLIEGLKQNYTEYRKGHITFYDNENIWG